MNSLSGSALGVLGGRSSLCGLLSAHHATCLTCLAAHSPSKCQEWLGGCSNQKLPHPSYFQPPHVREVLPPVEN